MDAQKTKIQQAALSLFSERGYSGTTLAAIAAEAGVNPALIYQHFSGKRALFDSLQRPELDFQDSAEVRRREEIVQSALQVFSQKGYAAATMDEIAEGLGVVKGASAVDDTGIRAGANRLLQREAVVAARGDRGDSSAGERHSHSSRRNRRAIRTVERQGASTSVTHRNLGGGTEAGASVNDRDTSYPAVASYDVREGEAARGQMNDKEGVDFRHARLGEAQYGRAGAR